MISGIATDRRANLLGSVWMIASMAGFAVEDTFIKAASTTLPIAQILILFGLGGALLFAFIAVMNKEPLFTKDVVSRPMRIRVCFEIIGRLFYVLAISLIPLSAATVILQATPLVVVAGAALVFGEKVGWRRWAAIFVGLVGVIVIVQPGTDGFSMLSILAIIGMIGFAGRDLASRAAPASLTTSVLGFYGFLSIIVAGALFSLWESAAFVALDLQVSSYMLGAVLAGVAAYSCLMKAMRTGEVSAVTPFRYTRLLFGIGFGIAFFGEQLSYSMMFGSGLIVLSGLFILWRGRNTKRQ
ncbi:DMT family transporter [uncultured Sulfitobacter sp.]|uniref:DMT family transporter n=1 Tax=uncultured Sulfitobacter sp. TaxID=191468 RepID=UPI0030D95795|tara:strand:- start:190598 stop:191491 length:894 start_codon:yes stop_codon:yes gene_type:complete